MRASLLCSMRLGAQSSENSHTVNWTHTLGLPLGQQGVQKLTDLLLGSKLSTWRKSWMASWCLNMRLRAVARLSSAFAFGPACSAAVPSSSAC